MCIRWTLTLLMLLVPLVAQPEETRRPSILVIYGYIDFSPWIQKFNFSLAESVGAGKTTMLQVEFAEFRGHTEAENLAYANAVKEKISKYPPDMVIAVLPDAARFTHQHIQPVLSDIPFVYVLPDVSLEAELEQDEQVTVIKSYWNQAVAETADLMQRLYPDLKNLYVIAGSANSNISYLKRAEAVFGEQMGSVNLLPLVGYTPLEIRNTLLTAPPDSAAFYVTMDLDRHGTRYSGPAVIAAIQNSKVPIFASLDTVEGEGVLGGSFTSAALYGLNAGKAANDLLGIPQTEAVQYTSGTRLSIDEKVMRQFGISHRLVPPGVVHLNHEERLWERYFTELVFGLLIIVVQALCIVLLYAESRRRKRMERDRENQTRLFDAVINGISDAVVVTDADGWIIATNSPGFEITFQMEPSSIKGVSIHRLFDEPVDLETGIAGVIACKGGGRYFPGETTIKPISDAESQVIGYFGVVRDVSERLAKEEELRQAHKMEAVGNLAGGIAHDFNNILMAIVGNAELAREAVHKASKERLLLDRILGAADRASDLVKQIMGFSRRDESESHQAVNLGELLLESKALIETSFPSSIETHIHVDPELAMIEASPTQIQQIVLNLCNNANHAMGGQGAIEIRAENVSLADARFIVTGKVPAGHYVKLSVSDSGVGISEADLPHIFDPFFTTKGREEGSGMGLAMVYRIVDSHDGYIDVETSEQGSTFMIYLPAPAVIILPAAEPTAPTTERLWEPKPRILLVDDDDMVLRATEGSLRQIGCQVTAYLDPRQALEAFQQKPGEFDLLLTDQVMPGLDGLTLIQEVRQVRDVPAMLCTGNADVSRLQDLPNATLLRKPFTQSDLHSALALMLFPTDHDKVTGGTMTLRGE